jgi:hypothetical protein
MEKKMNKRIIKDIDETFLLNSIAEQGIVKETTKSAPELAETEKNIETPEPSEKTGKVREAKETGKRKRSPGNADYGHRFLQRNEFKMRQYVYISQHIHTTISEIVRVISDREITVDGYIDSILTEHLEAHKEEITELYNRELEKKSGKRLMEF